MSVACRPQQTAYTAVAAAPTTAKGRRDKEGLLRNPTNGQGAGRTHLGHQQERPPCGPTMRDPAWGGTRPLAPRSQVPQQIQTQPRGPAEAWAAVDVAVTSECNISNATTRLRHTIHRARTVPGLVRGLGYSCSDCNIACSINSVATKLLHFGCRAPIVPRLVTRLG